MFAKKLSQRFGLVIRTTGPKWFVLVCLCLASAIQAAEPKKVALLVGVNKYLKAGLRNLDFPEADVEAVGAELKKLGFQVAILKGSATGTRQATRANIEAAARAIVEPLGKDDLMLVMLAGHGQQLEITDGEKKRDDGFYCPVEAVPNEPKTLFSLSHLTDEILAPNVGKKLVIIDACRDVPKDPGRGARGIQGKVISLPEGTAVLFGCQAGQQTYENDELGHGLFTHCLLEGLRGKAAKDGRLTWTNLAGYVEGRLSDDDMKARMPKNRPQEPIAAGGVGQLVLARVDRNDLPVEPKFETETTNTLGMKFRLIPAGEFMMGNEDSVEALLREFPYAKKEWVEDAAHRHKVRITKPFYLGVYPVTLNEFLTFHQDAKYKCDCEKDGKGGWGYDAEEKTFAQKPQFVPWDWGFKEQTMKHPVVNVSWNDATAFCTWLSKKEGKTYRLPTEAEWEYACRAGTTTRYIHGDDPEGLVSVANTWDAGTKDKFPNTKNQLKGTDGYVFTSPVDAFRPNKFGLYDMNGNVRNWCSDWYGEDYYASSPTDDPQGASTGSNRVYRGGSWDGLAVRCRSANRSRNTPDFRYNDLGFRLALVPSS